jgi:DNA-binding NarL/FixJ family response regulator
MDARPGTSETPALGAETTDGKITVLIVEDDYFARQAMAALMVADDITVVAIVPTPDEALATARGVQPRVALIDMRLQGDNRAGIAVIRQVREVSPETACCIITGSDMTGELYADALYAGAQGYSRKGDSQNSDLRVLARRLARGEWVIDSELAARFAKRAVATGQLPLRPVGGEEPRLTRREKEVIPLVAQQLSTDEIADRLTVSRDTVKSHIKNIIAKFQVQNRDQAALYAILKGYLSGADRDG